VNLRWKFHSKIHRKYSSEPVRKKVLKIGLHLYKLWPKIKKSVLLECRIYLQPTHSLLLHCCCCCYYYYYYRRPVAHSHTHTRLTALCPGLPGWAGTRKVKPIWILLKQQTVSGSEIRWAICKSAPCSRQITTPAPHRSVFLPPNQQRQST